MGISKASQLVAFFLFLLPSCATLKDYDGPALSAQKIASGSFGTVLFWWANECPCVVRFQARIEALKERYESRGISFVAISSNSNDTPAQTDRTSNSRNFKLPILHDQGGRLAEQLGAKTTPTVVVLDAKGDVRFRGWIDNERFEGDEGRVAYLENAIKDLLSNQTVTAPTSPIYGCRITKRLR